MIIVIIGQSGSGKTTFAKNNFLRGEIEIIPDIVPYTTNGLFCGVGKYGIGIRTEGTDTLPYNSGGKIRELVKKLHAEGRSVLLEGDRINNRATFDFLSTLNADVKLYLVTCSLETSLARLKAAGSAITPPFVKGTKTRSMNNFLQYGGRFNGEIINSD